MANSPRLFFGLRLPAVLAVLTVFCLVAWMGLPLLVGGGPSKAFQIVSNLKQIDLAKQMWASDNHATGSVQVTEQNLAAYFNRDGSKGLVIPVVGEQYVINPLGASPEAQLTRSFGKFPKGAVIRLRGGGLGYETIPPKLEVQRNGSRSAEDINQTSPAAGSRR